MNLNRYRPQLVRITICQILFLSLSMLLIGQGQQRKGIKPFTPNFTSQQTTRWVLDSKTIDFSLVGTRLGEDWGIFSFSPDFPGQTVIEERAVKDEKTGGCRVLPGTGTKPLVRGNYTVLDSLGAAIERPNGSYRYEATLGLTGVYLGSEASQKYLTADPRFIGGICLARLNERKDSTQFDPIFALPPQWLAFVKPVVLEYRDLNDPVQRHIEDSDWLLDRMKSPNPLWRIIAFRAMLKKPKLDEVQNAAVKNQFLAATGLEKAIVGSLIIDSDRSTKRFNNLLSDDAVKSAVSMTSAQDIYLLLNTLLDSDIYRTHNPITGKESLSFGPSLLRVLIAKIEAADEKDSSQDKNKAILKSFIIGPSKITIPENETQ